MLNSEDEKVVKDCNELISILTSLEEIQNRLKKLSGTSKIGMVSSVLNQLSNDNIAVIVYAANFPNSEYLMNYCTMSHLMSLTFQKRTSSTAEDFAETIKFRDKMKFFTPDFIKDQIKSSDQPPAITKMLKDAGIQ